MADLLLRQHLEHGVESGLVRLKFTNTLKQIGYLNAQDFGFVEFDFVIHQSANPGTQNKAPVALSIGNHVGVPPVPAPGLLV